MGKTNTGLVAFCEQALAAGTGYVYGTIGQVCTKSLLEQCAPVIRRTTSPVAQCESWVKSGSAAALQIVLAY